MKTLKRIAAALLPALALSMASLPAAHAASQNMADFNREAAAPWSYIGVRTYGSLNDLFGDVTKELAPGDEKAVTVQLRNSSQRQAEFWLRAEALTGDGAKALEADFPSKAAVDALLGNISIDIDYQGAPIYAGSLGGVGTSDLYTGEGVSLGTLEAGAYGAIEVSLRVSAALGNEYQNSMCAVRWIFTATQDDEEPPEEPTTTAPSGDGTPPGPGGGQGSIEPNDPGPGATVPPGDAELGIGEGNVPGGAGETGNAGDGAPDSRDDGQVEDLPEGDIPQGAPGDPDMVVVADPNTPLGLPQTGGLLTYATPAALALIALLALYAATYLRGRNRKGGIPAAEGADGVAAGAEGGAGAGDSAEEQ